jgi:hypothetical protein
VVCSFFIVVNICEYHETKNELGQVLEWVFGCFAIGTPPFGNARRFSLVETKLNAALH